MNSEQANSVADALLLEKKAQQAALVYNRTHQARLTSARRYAAVYGLIGFVVGTLAGYLIFSKVFPAAIIGLGFGWVVGRCLWFVGRKA